MQLSRYRESHRLSQSAEFVPLLPTAFPFFSTKRIVLPPLVHSSTPRSRRVSTEQHSAFESRSFFDETDEVPTIGLFSAKVRKCEQIFEFPGLPRNCEGIAEKTSLLKEIQSEILNVQPPLSYISASYIDLVFHMIELNIVRSIRIDPRVGVIGDTMPTVDPAWPHLSIVYEILLVLVRNFANDEHFSDQFMRSLLGPCGSPDLNERSVLYQFFVNFLKKRPGDRARFLSLIEFALTDYMQYPALHSPYLVCTMLQLMLFIVDEMSPMPPVSVPLFNRAVVPLLTSPHLHLFNKSMITLVELFLENSRGPAIQLVGVLMRHFNRALAAHQELMIGHLDIGLCYLPSKILASWTVNVARLLAEAAGSLCEGLAQSAVNIWSGQGGNRFLSAQKNKIIPIVVPTVYRMLTDHWSTPVRNASRKAITIFQKIDPRLTNLSVKETPREVDKTRLETWRLLAQTAQYRKCVQLFVGDVIVRDRSRRSYLDRS